MNNEQLFTALTRSSRKALNLYRQATGDSRAIGGQVEVGDIVNSAYESYLTITARLGAPIAFTIAEHAPVFWYGDDETGHPVTAFAVVKWAVRDAMQRNGLRRSQENPTDESLDIERHSHAHVPSVTTVRGALKSDDVETVSAGLRVALSELPDYQAHALVNAFRVFRESSAEREFDAVGQARAVLMDGLRESGLSRDKARLAVSALAGDVLGTINATRDMFNA
jgi:hypothetical protein